MKPDLHRILLVEDDEGHALLLRLTLAEVAPRASLELILDGERALTRLKESASGHRPDLMILDLKLPRLDGHELLAEVKSDPKLQSLPVLVVTTSTKQTDAELASVYSRVAFLNKPVPPVELRRAIEGLGFALQAG
ncbi:MAG: response regulator [Phycisphaerae bacterium]|nr:response regulator [Phycisphaerae bacterium]NUQ08616.1 response regulator [Phycisphaerae bacterium]